MFNIASNTASGAALVAALAMPAALFAQSPPKPPGSVDLPVCTLQAPPADPTGRRTAPRPDALAYLRYLQQLRAATYWGTTCGTLDKNLQILIRGYEGQQKKGQARPHRAAARIA